MPFSAATLFAHWTVTDQIVRPKATIKTFMRKKPQTRKIMASLALLYC